MLVPGPPAIVLSWGAGHLPYRSVNVITIDRPSASVVIECREV
jgi:hypothetical protein